MARLTNTPQQQMTFDLERRKSYSFRCVLLHADRFPLDLTGCTLRFVMKREEYDEDLFDTTNQLINSEALILSPEAGEGTFSFQASELDGPPGAYNYAIVLWTKDGYSVVVTKGTVNLHPNTDSLSIMQNYTTNTADAALEITLRGNDVLNIVTNTLTRSEARVEIVGTGRPDDAATLEANTINEVANARVGTLFISLDGAGIGAWAWRKRRDGWFIVEGMPLVWTDIQGRPSQFPPTTHNHLWSEITGKPLRFTPSDHTHGWSDLTGVPGTFNPAPHTHPWGEVSGKPATFAPAPHTHKWIDLTQVPASFPPAEHFHAWAEITGKPSSFTPAAHSHAWAEITGKPSSFTPASHQHPISDLSATGTKDSSTFLRGDGTWSPVDLSAITSREYWGIGRPDVSASMDAAGQAWVAAATSGAEFRSLDGPQGAWVWRKRGATWVCVEGDTGWTTPIPLNGAIATGGTISYRRLAGVGVRAIVAAATLAAGSGSGGLHSAAPVGFRAPATYKMVQTGSLTISVIDGQRIAIYTDAALHWVGATTATAMTATRPAAAFSADLTWPSATDSWPLTL